MTVYVSNLRISSYDISFLRRSSDRLSCSRRIVKTVEFYSPHRCRHLKLLESKIERHGCSLQHDFVCPRRCMNEGSLDMPPLDDWDDNEGISSDIISSSEGEDSDGEILVTPINDVDMPTVQKQHVTSEDALTVTAHRLAFLGRTHKKYRIRYGFVTNLGLITFLIVLLAVMDWGAWRIVRLPLEPFFFIRPFLLSAVLVASAGYISIPLLKRYNICQKIKRKGPARYFSQKGIPTLGGLFFVPIGVIFAKVLARNSLDEVSSVAAVTLALAAVGLFDDIIGLIKHQSFGLSVRTRLALEFAVALWFSFWLDSTDISSPYGMKMLVPLPAPIGLVNLGKCYLLLTSVSFVSMGSGIAITDDLDGLAGGVAALAFAGMSIAVLPICSGLSVFGASMSGACVGFLLHNRHKASVLMGNTGCLAIGGALAAMASCTGMFLPLLIGSGVLVLDMLSVIIQVCYLKMTRRSRRASSHRSFRMLPFHSHLLLRGVGEPLVVAGAYAISFVLAIIAGHVGLVAA